eukprot:scaffold9544_cov97-Skeletonema_marinoi.AAC.4
MALSLSFVLSSIPVTTPISALGPAASRQLPLPACKRAKPQTIFTANNRDDIVDNNCSEGE